jgi:hypothetical protein
MDTKDDDIKDISFKESFRRARQAGLKGFTFNGKKYTTELASGSKATSAKSAMGAAVKRAEGKEAGAKSSTVREMAASPSSETATDDPLNPGYFKGRVNPNTLLPYQSEMKRGGKVKAYAKGGSVSSASKRADGCATKGKTKCKVY